MKARAVLAVLVITLTATACAGGYEQALLTQFFAASRLLDRTALQNISTVIFDPRTDGTVIRFDIENIAPDDHGGKRVTVSARVHLPNGDTVPKTLIVTMRPADPAIDKGTTSRWIITKVVTET